MGVVETIQAFNAGRDAERLAIKYQKMRSSAFAFMRGSCHLFYQQLPSGLGLKSAPATWACGDLHLENFGSFKGDNRQVYFDINDFDEGVLAPASWDLLRLMTSLRVWGAGYQLDAAELFRYSNALLNAYTAALKTGKAYWLERETAQGPVRDLLSQLKERSRQQFLAARTQVQGKQRILRVDGSRALPATPEKKAWVTQFMQQFAESQANPAFYQPLDVARRIAGTGSLGVERYVILIAGKGGPTGNYLLDLKRANPSAVQPPAKFVQPRWKSDAERIVACQTRMQAMPMAFLCPVWLGNEAFVLRGLQATEDRLVLSPKTYRKSELVQVLETMGRLLAWAQLRSAGRDGADSVDTLMAYGARRQWQEKLLLASQMCTETVLQDAAAFNAAYDAGSFHVA